MKKISVLLAFMMVCLYSKAYDVEINGIFYNLIKKAKSATVTYEGTFPGKTSKYQGNLKIPSSFEYDGITYTVTEINGYAFRYCDELETIQLPSTITKIGDYAFNNCKKLNNVVIPSSVMTYGVHIFSVCKNLSSITLPDGINEIPEGMFSSDNNLSYIEIPKSVKKICKSAFSYCPFSSINLDNVEFIEHDAFFYCTSLALVNLPNITTIGYNAFYGCSKLSTVYIGEKISIIGEEAFIYCKELADVYCFRKTVLKPFSITTLEGTGPNVFKYADINYATLHVPSTLINEYKNTEIWSEFGSIVALNDNDIPPSSINETEIDNEKIIIYDIQGRRVDKPQKGLYIVNGKKLLIK